MSVADGQRIHTLPLIAASAIMAGWGTCSTLKEKHSQFTRVEDVERVIGLTCDLKAEALAHDAVEAVTILSIHLFFHNLASHLLKSNH